MNMKRIISLCNLFCVAALGLVFLCCTNNALVKEHEDNNTETTVSDSTGIVAAVNNIKSHKEDIQALWELSIGKDKKFTKYALANDYVVLGTENGKDCLLLSFFKDMKDIDKNHLDEYLSNQQQRQLIYLRVYSKDPKQHHLMEAYIQHTH